MNIKNNFAAFIIITSIIIGVMLTDFLINNFDWVRNLNPLVVLIVSIILLSIAFSQLKKHN